MNAILALAILFASVMPAIAQNNPIETDPTTESVLTSLHGQKSTSFDTRVTSCFDERTLRSLMHSSDDARALATKGLEKKGACVMLPPHMPMLFKKLLGLTTFVHHMGNQKVCIAQVVIPTIERSVVAVKTVDKSAKKPAKKAQDSKKPAVISPQIQRLFAGEAIYIRIGITSKRMFNACRQLDI